MEMGPLAAVIGFAMVGAALVATGARRRNRDSRRQCPRCRYDLTATADRRCPECGCEWAGEAQLFVRPARRSRLIAGTLALGLAVFISLPLFSGRHWTYFVPKPMLSWALSMLVADQPIAPGSYLPAPNKAFMYSRNRWERLVWQQQAATALERFLNLVEQCNGSLADVERLVPAALEAQGIFQQVCGTEWEDFWPVDRVKSRARARQAQLDGQFTLPLGTWAAAELQCFYGDSDTRDSRWIASPLEVLLPLSQSSDAVVRGYTLDRMAYLPASEASAAFERLANDPDPAVRDHAARILKWRHDMRRWP